MYCVYCKYCKYWTPLLALVVLVAWINHSLLQGALGILQLLACVGPAGVMQV